MGKCLQDGTWSADLLLLGVSDEDQELHTEEENDFVMGAYDLIDEENDTLLASRDIRHAVEWDEWLDAREIGLLERSIELGEWVDGSSEDDVSFNDDIRNEEPVPVLQVSLPEDQPEAAPEVPVVLVSEPESRMRTLAQWLQFEDRETEEEREQRERGLALFLRDDTWNNVEARVLRGHELARA